MSFWLFAFSWDFTIIFSSVGFHAKLPECYICFSVSLGEKGQVGKAVQLSNKKVHSLWRTVSSVPLHFRFSLLRCRVCFFFIWLWSEIYCEYEHRVTASTAAAGDLIPSRTVLRWWGPRVQTVCWPSVDKLPCCWGAGQRCLQPEVIWLLRNGCCWSAALQLLFPCLSSHVSPRPFSLSPR